MNGNQAAIRPQSGRNQTAIRLQSDHNHLAIEHHDERLDAARLGDREAGVVRVQRQPRQRTRRLLLRDLCTEGQGAKGIGRDEKGPEGIRLLVREDVCGGRPTLSRETSSSISQQSSINQSIHHHHHHLVPRGQLPH